ncbi:MAG: hypothetical protein ACK5MI_08895 [Mangrovibacterium sp.]
MTTQLTHTFSAQAHTYAVRKPMQLSFGSEPYCQEILFHALQTIDKSAEMQWLPEYNEVARWMSNSRGKGLFLTGDCGRGKTNLIAFALPYIFQHFACFKGQRSAKILQSVHIDELHQELQKGMLKKAFYVVDEVGAEAVESVYGSKYYPFMKLMNKAEAELKLCFFSSNLNSHQLAEKYDVRTVERISRLCKVVQFKGASLRI